MAVTARLFLEITNGKKTTIYEVEPIDPHPDVAAKAWRLTKADGEIYDVAMMPHGGTTCTCADWLWRKKLSCKHVKAVMACGLMQRKKKT